MPSSCLRALLSTFVEESAGLLAADRARGAELPFDVVRQRSVGSGRTALYCYRPMTGEFIQARGAALSRLPGFAPAVHALAGVDGLDGYLRTRGCAHPPADMRARAEAALLALLLEVFEEATEFDPRPQRLARVCDSLEATARAGRRRTEVVAVLWGLALESRELDLGDGLALAAPEVLADHPATAGLRSDGDPPALVAVWGADLDTSDAGGVGRARLRLRRLLTALRLYADVAVALEPLGWTRLDEGPWTPAALPGTGVANGRHLVLSIQEDELRAFCNLISRRTPRDGAPAWALGRFEMASERAQPAEALTDRLLALRTLLEPEGPDSQRLAERLAALCAVPIHHDDLADRVTRAIALERSLMLGAGPTSGEVEDLSEELGAHLRALLRDVLCGHLDGDLCRVADDLLEETVADPEPAPI